MGITADPGAIQVEARKRYRLMVERDLKLMPFARETLEKTALGFITALVTNTPLSQVEPILKRAGLRDYLHHLVTREDYADPKPAPDCYLAASRKTGCAPAECLAVEDAPRGVRAAVAAGMPCVAVLNEMTRYEPPEGAVAVLNSLSELDVEELAGRWPITAV
jgi:HAD superfamily hydrolase (TIGR01509 family)